MPGPAIYIYIRLDLAEQPLSEAAFKFPDLVFGMWTKNNVTLGRTKFLVQTTGLGYIFVATACADDPPERWN